MFIFLTYRFSRSGLERRAARLELLKEATAKLAILVNFDQKLSVKESQICCEISEMRDNQRIWVELIQEKTCPRVIERPDIVAPQRRGRHRR